MARFIKNIVFISTTATEKETGYPDCDTDADNVYFEMTIHGKEFVSKLDRSNLIGSGAYNLRVSTDTNIHDISATVNGDNKIDLNAYDAGNARFDITTDGQYVSGRFIKDGKDNITDDAWLPKSLWVIAEDFDGNSYVLSAAPAWWRYQGPLGKPAPNKAGLPSAQLSKKMHLNSHWDVSASTCADNITELWLISSTSEISQSGSDSTGLYLQINDKQLKFENIADHHDQSANGSDQYQYSGGKLKKVFGENFKPQDINQIEIVNEGDDGWRPSSAFVVAQLESGGFVSLASVFSNNKVIQDDADGEESLTIYSKVS